MAAGEVENVAHRFLTSLGRGTEWDPEDFDSVAAVIPAFKFGIFLTIMEEKYAKEVDEGGLKEAVSDIHDYFIKDVIKKVHFSIILRANLRYKWASQNYVIAKPHLIFLITTFRATWERKWIYFQRSENTFLYSNPTF